MGGLTLCLLPFQFDKYTPKLDSPYFRHSNVSVLRALGSPGRVGGVEVRLLRAPLAPVAILPSAPSDRWRTAWVVLRE